MSHETTQPSLLLRVRNPDDQAAWREFDEKYRGLILGYCRVRGLQPSDAEDVRQSVMLNLTRFLPHFDYQPSKGKFRYYLGRAVKNAIAQHFARQKGGDAALDTAVLATVPASGEVETDELWEREWVDHHYRLAMKMIRASFEPRSVQVFEELLAGQTPEQAAAKFELNAAAVYKIKQRIRDRLKELIDEQVKDEDDG
jgi:RNA polymerase sigma-70 factor (ECF subfamily)